MLKTLLQVLVLLVLVVLFSLVVSAKESEQYGGHYDEDGEHMDNYDHEAILGSDDAVEEFSHLPAQEAKKRLGQLVDRMDDDKSGSVSKLELTKWIKNSFMSLNLEETEEKMQLDDTNADGLLTWKEYMFAVYGMNDTELEEFAKSELEEEESKTLVLKSIAYDKEKFKAADLNADNVLDKHEYAAFLHPYDYPQMSKTETNRVLADYDLNKDGQVEWDEFAKNPVFKQKSEEDMIGEHVNFKHNDLNGDGALSRDEILKWLTPNIDEVAKDEATHLLDATDADEDGELSKEEIIAEHELWVGSEATDYGEMLRDEL